MNIDPGQLAAADTAGATTRGLRSLLVVRNGVLVDEQYYGSATASSLEDGRSITKSVTSLLSGLALSLGIFSGTGMHLDALIHPPVAQVSAAESAITLDNLLTMTSGFAWDESTAAGYNAWVLSPNQVEYLLAEPLSDLPGLRFNYNSAAVHLISVGLSEATRASTQAFASANLFAALGIQDFSWETDQQGYNNGAAGLALHPRDFAKFGQLVLQNGASGAESIVPAGWVEQSFLIHASPSDRVGPLSTLSYGYLWWLGSWNSHHLEFAWGYRGQFIVVVPDLELVVVATSDLTDASIPPYAEADGVMTLIIDYVLPAVH